jgi:hypothetical protein
MEEEQVHQVLQLGPPVHNLDYQDNLQPTIVKHSNICLLLQSMVDYQRQGYSGEGCLKGTLSKKQVTKFY